MNIKDSRIRIILLLFLIMVCAVSGAGMLIVGLLRTSIPHLRRMLCGEIPFELTHDAVIFAAAMLSLFMALVPGAAIFWYLRFQVMRPLRRAEEFLEQLSRGSTPAPLPTGELASRRIQTLFSELNLLRDRLRSLNARLEHGLAHEAELRRELEKYDRMQITLMARLLPETRRSIGVIKGLLLGGEPESTDDERGELYSRALHRTAALSREVERLIDFSRLGLARWNDPRSELFEVAPFMRELVNRSKAHLRARNISFESGFSGRPPGRLQIDRELLYQLLSIMIRAVGRLSAAGSSVKLTCRGDGHSAEFEVSCPVCDRLSGDFAARLAEAADSGFTSDKLPVEMLALGVVQDIAGRLGCRLTVRRIDGGADLVMELPHELCHFESDKLEFFSLEERGDETPPERSSVRRGGENRNRCVLMWSEDEDETLAISAVLSRHNIRVKCFPVFADIEAELPREHYDGVILSPGSFGVDPGELVFRLRRLVGRPNLAVTVLSPQMSDEMFRRLADLDRVSVLIMPINYEMLASAFGG